MANHLVRYQGTVSKSAQKLVANDVLGVVRKNCADFTFEVTIGDSAIRIVKDAYELVHDLPKRKKTIIDHEKRICHLASSRDSRSASTVSGGVARQVASQNSERDFKLDGQVHHVWTRAIEVGQAIVKYSCFASAPYPCSAQACKVLWQGLVPWLGEPRTPNTLPAKIEIVVGQETVATLAAVSIAETQKPVSVEVPKDYRITEITPSRRNRARVHNDGRARSHKTHIAEHIERGNLSLFGNGAADGVSATNLSDFAWLNNQPFLDNIKEVANRLSGTVNSWRIYQKVLFVDWWNDGLRWHINPEQPEGPGVTADLFVTNLKRIYFLLQLVAKNDVGLNEQERSDLARLRDDIAVGEADNSRYQTTDVNINEAIQSVKSHDHSAWNLLKTLAPARAVNETILLLLSHDSAIRSYMSEYFGFIGQAAAHALFSYNSTWFRLSEPIAGGLVCFLTIPCPVCLSSASRFKVIPAATLKIASKRSCYC